MKIIEYTVYRATTRRHGHRRAVRVPGLSIVDRITVTCHFTRKSILDFVYVVARTEGDLMIYTEGT